MDERLGLSALIERHLLDPRIGGHRQFPLADLLRQSIYSRLAGYGIAAVLLGARREGWAQSALSQAATTAPEEAGS